ncbi:MAG: glycosyltransferase family 2 protein [Actinobacteria bacterium]|nr:glycosyltransferase family 2 protein [Actinomycetota bacterium]
MTGALARGDWRPLNVVDVDLTSEVAALDGLEDYAGVMALVWSGGTPIGYARIPVKGGGCSARQIRSSIRAQLGRPLAKASLCHRLGAGIASERDYTRDFDVTEEVRAGNEPLPSMTVVICTRDRPQALDRCLGHIRRLRYPALDVVVVDNAPPNDTVRRLVQEKYPDFRYIREPQQGLGRARNAALDHSRGEIVAFTDDDCAPDPSWAESIGRVFADDQQTMAVTGLVVPFELETPAQILFEQSGGFGRGFEHRRWQLRAREANHLGAGRFGTGANMAFRRSVFLSIGDFDVALGAGTPTEGGEDLDMFFRVLEEGYALVYEPRAVVRHVHRRDLEGLQRQLEGHGTGLYAYFVRSALMYPNRRVQLLRLSLRWLWSRHVRRLLGSFIGRRAFPRELVWAELRGSLRGLTAYPRARRAGGMRELPARPGVA